MKTSVHVLFSLILAAMLYPIFGWKVLLVLAGGVLIDVDHYFWYVYNQKKFDLIGCYNYFIYELRKNNWKDIQGSVLIFHTVEFFILLALLAFYSSFVMLFLIGLLGHYFLDFLFFYSVPKRAILNYSLISWYFKHQIQKV